MENTEKGNQQPNPFEMVLMKMDMMESHIMQLSTYIAQLSKVNNNGWESYEEWSKRIAQEMKFSTQEIENFDFSIKRKSGIITN